MAMYRFGPSFNCTDVLPMAARSSAVTAISVTGFGVSWGLGNCDESDNGHDAYNRGIQPMLLFVLDLDRL